jgi:hypothetical protein
MSPNLPRCPWILALVLAAAAPAHAYVGPERPRPGGVATPAGAGPWIAVADLAGWSPQWAAAEQLLGEGWQVAFAAASGAPAWIIGPGLPLGRPAGADDGTVALARALVERLAGALNVEDVSSLVLDRAVSSPNVQGHEIVGIQFRWTAHGRDVRGPLGNLRVHLTFNGTLGRLAAIGSELVTGVEAPSDPTFPLATAVAAALDRSERRSSALRPMSGSGPAPSARKPRWSTRSRSGRRTPRTSGRGSATRRAVPCSSRATTSGPRT